MENDLPPKKFSNPSKEGREEKDKILVLWIRQMLERTIAMAFC